MLNTFDVIILLHSFFVIISFVKAIAKRNV